MIIGIDIDDTITNNCEVWFDLYNKYTKCQQCEFEKSCVTRDSDDKKCDKTIILTDAYKWNFYDEYPQTVKDNLFAALEKQDMYYDNLSILDNAKNTIQELMDSGHQVIFISATFKEYQERKKSWILSNFPDLKEDDIIFTSQKHLINVDVMIDDNLDYASKFNCPFIRFKQPWNSNRPQDLYTDNVLICSNWNEIERYFISQNIILPETVDREVVYNQATMDLIEGIKNAKNNQECITILNPYIKLWQEQGILIGIARMSDFLGRFAQDVEDEINKK